MTTIKCLLAGLKCYQELRYEIDDCVKRLHSIAIKGSLVATQVLLVTLENGESVPVIGNQTWWNRCFTSCGIIEGRDPCRPHSGIRSRKSSSDPAIEEASKILFSGNIPWTPMDYMWSFIAELAMDSLTACQNIIASTFHVQLEKAIHREVTIWEVEQGRGLSKASKWRIATYYVRLAIDHSMQAKVGPDDLPIDLRRQLDILVKAWKTKFSEVLPCPHSSFLRRLKAF